MTFVIASFSLSLLVLHEQAVVRNVSGLEILETEYDSEFMPMLLFYDGNLDRNLSNMLRLMV